MLKAINPSNSIINQAEHILWNKLPSNQQIISSLANRTIKNSSSLHEMSKLLKAIGHSPESLDALNIVHVAGSKGKGSVCALSEAIFRAHGLQTAMFTSPHLVHPRERLKINGRSTDIISFSQAVVDLWRKIEDIRPIPGFFRFMALLSFDQMLRLQERGLLDVAIIEVGMGGSFDATNVICSPRICAITCIEMEHVAVLGPSIEQIASHKAGIIKNNSVVIGSPQITPEITNIIKQRCRETNSILHLIDDASIAKDGSSPHQTNSAQSIEICKKWIEIHNKGAEENKNIKFSPRLSELAISKCRWPGRTELITMGKVDFFLDGAHTKASMEGCAKWFSQKTSSTPSRKTLFFHCGKDKNFECLLTILMSISWDRVVFAKPVWKMDTFPECLDFHQEMALFWNAKRSKDDVEAEYGYLKDFLDDGGLEGACLVTGSLYLVGDLLGSLKIEIP